MKFLNKISGTNAKAINPKNVGRGHMIGVSPLESMAAYQDCDELFGTLHFEISQGFEKPSDRVAKSLKKLCWKAYEQELVRLKRKGKFTKINIKIDESVVDRLVSYTISTYTKYYGTKKQPSAAEIYRFIGVSSSAYVTHYERLYLDFREIMGEGMYRVEKNSQKYLA